MAMEREQTGSKKSWKIYLMPWSCFVRNWKEDWKTSMEEMGQKTLKPGNSGGSAPEKRTQINFWVSTARAF